VSNYKDLYQNEIVPALFKEFGYKSLMEVPKIDKIVLNMGIGDAVFNAKVIDDCFEEMQQLSGQLPVVTKAKKSISNFKLRQGMPIGLKVTLRKEKMYYFLEKLIKIALPRVRDFRGISGNAFDGRGNYALGIKEQIIFPEINLDKVKKTRGLDIIIVTTAKNDKAAKSLLEKFGMPFKK
jgi:large subunit ribosomal protein L5